ncbi:MAG: competence/damage-inducible protein A [Clostridia bacterium]|nr:competence/damage-inducible protein A [Clostridia bacterium]
MISEILCVGTELLLGDIINTDGAFIARELAALGFSSYHQSTVGDNPARLREAIRVALGRSDVLILTGGLGPTCDDITKVAVADEFGLEMKLDEEVLGEIKSFFDAAGRVMTDNNISQAMIPEGATVFHNKWGTAPGIAVCGMIDGAEKHAILLPGPPSECEPMFMECARPYLARLSGDVIYSLSLHMRDIGESAAEAILRSIMEEYTNPTVAPYAMEHEVRIRITARAADEESAKKMCREMKETILAGEAGKYVYCETETPFEAKNATVLTLLKELRKNGMTFAAAESCTAGMIASRIGDIPGASDVLLGGVVSYANEVKENVLGVPHEVLVNHGAVSEECAKYMAEGVRRVTGAGISVSVTGIAGPDGGSKEKPVGMVCFGVADAKGTYTETKRFGEKRSRAKIRLLTAMYAMMLVIKRLRGEI